MDHGRIDASYRLICTVNKFSFMLHLGMLMIVKTIHYESKLNVCEVSSQDINLTTNAIERYAKNNPLHILE